MAHISKKPSFMYEIPFTLAGIPCLIGIESYYKQPAMGKWADSDWDCYGYTECDWRILDRKGYVAKWLEKKITPSIQDDIDEAIENFGKDDGYL